MPSAKMGLNGLTKHSLWTNRFTYLILTCSNIRLGQMYPPSLKFSLMMTLQQGAHYMIPETYQANSIILYKATSFPSSWAKHSTLLTGKPFIDTCILFYDNVIWLWVSTGDTTSLYYKHGSGDSVDGDGVWVEHPKSPLVVRNARYGRPGGRVVAHAGAIFR